MGQSVSVARRSSRAMRSKVARSFAAADSPNTSLNRSCANFHARRPCANLARPVVVSTTRRLRRSLSPATNATRPSRSSGRRLCPRADRSSTSVSANSPIVGGASACRWSSSRIAYCVERSPADAKASSYSCVIRRVALRMAVALHGLSPAASARLGTIVLTFAGFKRDLSNLRAYAPFTTRGICPNLGIMKRLKTVTQRRSHPCR